MFKLFDKANSLVRRFVVRSGSKRQLSTGSDLNPLKKNKPQYKRRTFSLGGPNDPPECKSKLFLQYILSTRNQL